MANVFNVDVFFVVFRETIEAVIIVSVLLAFLKQGLGGSADDPVIYKKLTKQVWFGSIAGVVICLILGCAFIGVFYSLKNDIWGSSEDIWEGVFCIIATVLISIMGIAMLRVNKMKEKWRVKLAQAIIARPEKTSRFSIGHWGKKYAMFILPFITCLREGLEAVVFVGGVGLNSDASAFPLPVICGLIAGIAVGVILYYSGSTVSLQIFLVVSTCFLYLIAAGLFSRGIWYFETYVYNMKTGGDATENGSGPGTYDITKSVWHVNCCNPEISHGWGIFNAILGWQNSATYGSVISYNIYWVVLIIVLGLMFYQEKTGHLPFTKNMKLKHFNPMYYIKGDKDELTEEQKEELFQRVRNQNNSSNDDSEERQSSEDKLKEQEVEKTTTTN
ncbi:MAG: FTR1 family protein [Staphylococcus equorum]|nr:FTR1 family protein [Staphylococcus equorum]